MMHLKNCLILFCLAGLQAFSQDKAQIRLHVFDDHRQSLPNASVELFQKRDSALVKIQLTDSTGVVVFHSLVEGDYFLRITHAAYLAHTTDHFFIPEDYFLHLDPVLLQPSANVMGSVTVSARKRFIEMKPGKTIVNVEAGISNAGATALEALEKMPGITVDKDGNISLKGRSGVTVLIDGKQTYLDAAQLSTILSGISASQISTVEIMDQASSRYDASGNAGLINIRLKKNQQKGFNGNLSTALAQGSYPKNTNSLQLNYRNGRVNLFLNYSVNSIQSFTRIYALRRYFDDNGSITSMLEQPSFFKGWLFLQNLRTGIDYSLGRKTNIGLSITGLDLHRKGNTNNPAQWLSATGAMDSLIQTFSNTRGQWKNGGINFNLRHAFNEHSELTMDADRIVYRIRGNQYFENNGVAPTAYLEASRADLPSDIDISSAKADYAHQVKTWKLEAGAKTSHITTDNMAAYDYFDGASWTEDLGKSNHFLYTENIHALYADAQTDAGKWKLQGGLRYEMTHYDADQLGNSLVKDSSFSRSYNSLFPSAFVSYELDSSNTFSLSAGRRIDRPAFQKLNPFVFIINKYTYQAGNPFFRPQYTWNIGLSHLYKNVLTTGLSYSVTKDYFSQIFPVSTNGIIIYTEGNLKRLQTFSASVSVQVSPTRWWSLTSQAVLVHKKMEGFIEREYSESVTQGEFNANNQFHFSRGWSGELSGFYNSKSRNDIQEVVDPAGQVSVGLAKTVLKNKGTIRLTARDLFYTQWMKGNTQFASATEYFKLTRDTRVVTVSLAYRFGKAFKTIKRSQGAAIEEMDRVGNG